MKSIGGAILAVLGYLARPEVLNVLPAKVGAIITGVGVILGVFGLRRAIAKNGQGV